MACRRWWPRPLHDGRADRAFLGDLAQADPHRSPERPRGGLRPGPGWRPSSGLRPGARHPGGRPGGAPGQSSWPRRNRCARVPGGGSGGRPIRSPASSAPPRSTSGARRSTPAWTTLEPVDLEHGAARRFRGPDALRFGQAAPLRSSGCARPAPALLPGPGLRRGVAPRTPTRPATARKPSASSEWLDNSPEGDGIAQANGGYVVVAIDVTERGRSSPPTGSACLPSKRRSHSR